MHFRNIAPEYGIIFSGTKAQFHRAADGLVGTYDHQSGDCHRPSATRIEYCKVEVYLNIFAREEQEDFTCRVICTDGEKTGHANPYEEWRARV